jgi:hypothetical protein
MSESPAAAPSPMESSRIARSDAAALADLQLHWGEVYLVGLDGDIWSATFRGSADELRAHDCFELRELIRVDYSYRQQAGLTEPSRGASDQAEDPDDRTSQPHECDPAPIRGERMSL